MGTGGLFLSAARFLGILYFKRYLILPFLTIHGICVYNWVRDILSQMTLCHQEEYDCIIQKRARRLDTCLHNGL